MSAGFTDIQRQLADHLREPEINPGPQNIEPRRLKIYQDLIFNNVLGFLDSGFPILKSLYEESDWLALARSFIVNHQSHTPYFLKISEEFLEYLQHEHQPRECDPAFMLELAHYEWVELALDVSMESFPEDSLTRDLLMEKPQVSPLAWSLSYQYPVHRLGPQFQPTEPPEQPTFLIVYRDRDERVQFMESNAMTVRLINCLETGEYTGREALLKLAEESQHPDPEALVAMGLPLLQDLQQKGVLI